MRRNRKMYIENDSMFKKYMRRTWHNKLIAIGLAMLGIILACIVKSVGENDITVSVFLWVIAAGMFFAKSDFREL